MQSSMLRDAIVEVGQAEARQRLRLVEVCWQGVWRRYLTHELDPQRLPPQYIASLYACRWRMEEAFLIVKRLLGLAYFWCAAQNAVELQMWSTWLLYAVLVDLTDEVAECLGRPFEDISVEMVYRGLYHYAQAVQRGDTRAAAVYLTAEAKGLGIIKRKRSLARPPQHLSAHLDDEVDSLTCY
jgi:hypothetical protein